MNNKCRLLQKKSFFETIGLQILLQNEKILAASKQKKKKREREREICVVHLLLFLKIHTDCYIYFNILFDYVVFD